MIRLALVLSLLSSVAYAQQPGPQGCNFGPVVGASQSPGANYSKTVGTSVVTLIPAAPNNITRTGIFIELLTASATLAILPYTAPGTTPSTSGGNGEIIITTGSSAPNNVAYLNFAGMGIIPTGPIQAIADSSGRVVSAWACPQ